MSETKNLLAEIEQFLGRTGMRATTFGLRAINDGKTVDRLRRGRTVTLETAAAIRKFMREYAPADTKKKAA